MKVSLTIRIIALYQPIIIIMMAALKLVAGDISWISGQEGKSANVPV